MSDKKKRNSDALQIYARVRGLMPWEPKKVSLQVVNNTVQNRSGKVINSYDFKKVFKPESTNEQCFNLIAVPMISNVLKGFNAVLIAYGQTGSGKTYSMLGKPKLGIVGILPRMLEFMARQKTINRVELSAVEAFGHHVAKIFLFDLYNSANQIKDWSLKKGDTRLEMPNATSVDINDAQDAHDKIILAHAASHFAPTGKNPESSRGHVSFIAKIHQELGQHEVQISYFIMVDCAGSEGETAFTPAFRAMVSDQVLLCRRLEAGTINTGLSQLQVVFNELRFKGKISNTVGIGLRRVLHPYINTKTYLSVLFTLSPSVSNAKATESTLKFAVTAGMVKVKPLQTKGKVNFKSLVAELKHIIEQQQQQMESNNDKIEAIRRQQNKCTLQIERSKHPNSNRFGDVNNGNKVQKMRKIKVKREIKNDDGTISYIEEEKEEIYYVDVMDNNNSNSNGLYGNNMSIKEKEAIIEKKYKPEIIDEETQNAMINELELATQELLNELPESIREILATNNNLRDENFDEEESLIRLKTILKEDNIFSEEEMKLVLEEYNNLSADWQKEQFVRKKKAEIIRQREEREKEMKLAESASQGLVMINKQIEESQNEYKRLQERQRELKEKLYDPKYKPQREELTEHAVELQILLAGQESVTEGLQQSKQIIMDYLKDDGREALMVFFQMRMAFN